MARIFIDGFETGTTALLNYVSGSVAVTTSSPISGSYMLYLANNGGYGKVVADTSVIYSAVSVRSSDLAAPSALIIRNGTTIIGRVLLSTATKTLRYSVGTTLVSTGSVVISSAITYRLEWFLQVSSLSSVGRSVVKINGTTDIDYTGVTQPGATTQFNQFWLGTTGVSYNSFQYFDDFVLDDATWIGNTKIIALSPSASGASTGWTPSAGENYACVDEVPITTADYVSVNTASALDLYNLPSVISSATSIKSVQISIRHEVEGSPTPTKTQIAIHHNSTSAFSSSLTPGAAGSPVYGTKLWDSNPVSGSSWTVADINSLQIGIKAATE